MLVDGVVDGVVLEELVDGLVLAELELSEVFSVRSLADGLSSGPELAAKAVALARRTPVMDAAVASAVLCFMWITVRPDR